MTNLIATLGINNKMFALMRMVVSLLFEQLWNNYVPFANVVCKLLPQEIEK
jgi:hypothetical protein